VGASIASPEAVAALFALKRRPTSSPLPVVAATRAALDPLVRAWPPGAERLDGAMWPGALTLVVAASGELCRLVRSTSGRVGFRVPDDPVLTALLAASGPLALTSANEHGAAPCVSAEGVLATFAGRDLAGVLDAGLRDGEVSTVVEFDGDEWRVVRAGAIPVERIAAALGEGPVPDGAGPRS
jgi:tRNA threonylcarbamoyl adenosine modification protein (Sua5/YciO/YrdC/YwlC family)